MNHTIEHTPFMSSFISRKYRQNATTRQESEMAEKNLRELQSTGQEDYPLQRLRLLCLSRGANGFLGLGRMFRRLDDNGKKQLNEDEFIHGLRETGLGMTDEEAYVLFHQLDEDNTGTIEMTKFLTFVRPEMSESRLRILEMAFNKIDKDEDGFITIKDLKRAYNVKADPRYISGEDSEEEILNRSLADFKLDATDDGMMTREEFFNYYAAVSTSIDSDGYFDLIIRQAYKL